MGLNSNARVRNDFIIFGCTALGFFALQITLLEAVNFSDKDKFRSVSICHSQHEEKRVLVLY